jgi:hypothetical protein
MLRRLFGLLLLAGTCLPAIIMAQGMEQNTDRPGQNYRVFDLGAPEPARCQAACREDGKCRAWTYVKPGVQGAKARCWLKAGVPPAKSNGCCVSGVKSGGPAPGQAPVPMTQAPPPAVSPRPPTGVPSHPPAPGVRKDLGSRVQIPPELTRRPTPVLARGALINRMLASPRTASRLNQFASNLGVPAQQLATRSVSGKAIGGGMPAVNPGGAMRNLDWENGVRFTPRSKTVSWMVSGVMIFQDLQSGKDYDLSGQYQRDELLLYAGVDLYGGSGCASTNAQIELSVDMPAGDYLVTVELVTPNTFGADLEYDCDPLCSLSLGGSLWPVIDKSIQQNQGVSAYTGLFTVPQSGRTHHVIRIPGKPMSQIFAIFRGITFTRL